MADKKYARFLRTLDNNHIRILYKIVYILNIKRSINKELVTVKISANLKNNQI